MFDISIITLRKMKPVRFHPYQSAVINRIVDINCDTEDLQRSYSCIEKDLCDFFNEKEVKAWVDNKIVFEVEFDGKTIFYGFYDWVFSIGVNVRNWNDKY